MILHVSSASILGTRSEERREEDGGRYVIGDVGTACAVAQTKDWGETPTNSLCVVRFKVVSEHSMRMNIDKLTNVLD